MSKDFEGAIWPNKKREKDTHPHFTGQATIDGVEYWVSAWRRAEDAKEGSPSLKFSFKPKENAAKKESAYRAGEHKRLAREHSAGFEDDSIPF